MINNDIYHYLDVKVIHEEPRSEEEILQEATPLIWVDGKAGKSINEFVFADTYIELNHLQYNNGLFYTKDGKKTQDDIAAGISESLRNMGIVQDIERITKKLLGTIKLTAHVPSLAISPYHIPFANGDFFSDK